jgi:hypothetical protein
MILRCTSRCYPRVLPGKVIGDTSTDVELKSARPASAYLASHHPFATFPSSPSLFHLPPPSPVDLSGGSLARTSKHGGQRHRHRQGALPRAPQQPRHQVEGRQALRRPGFPGRKLNRHARGQGERARHLPEASGVPGEIAPIRM